MASEESIKAGDLVMLKSGDGPVMVVEMIEECNYANCVWYDAKVFEMKKFSIKLEALKKYSNK